MKQRIKKKLLFIEPCLTSGELIVKAKENGHTTLVISAHKDHLSLPERILASTSSLFQIDTDDDEAVLDLAEKIDEKFHIDGVIPGRELFGPIGAKVASRLKKVGQKPEASIKAVREDVVRHILKAKGRLLEEFIEGQEYGIYGFLKNARLHIISISEKLKCPLKDRELGQIVHSTLNFPHLEILSPYVRQVTSALKLGNGAIQVNLVLKDNIPHFRSIKTSFPCPSLLLLISHATGIDYYDNAIRLFCDQPLNLINSKQSSAGSLFLSSVPSYHSSSIFVHDNCEVLKEEMMNSIKKNIQIFEV